LREGLSLRVSTKGRYGLRTLVDIAVHQNKGVVTLNDIAKRQEISVKYLWQVINPLKTAGLLSVTRGAKGGYALARRPEDINMLEVVSTLEGPLSIVECIMNEDACDRIDTCVARSVWMEVNQTVEQALKEVTLAEVLRRYMDTSEVSNYVI
jgi:Rrf2 family protein